MRHWTVNYIEGLLKTPPKLEAERRPKPMPGKFWPTRVAWYIQVASIKNDKFVNVRSLAYVGKPTRYRALQARKFLNQASQGSVILRQWQVEFDRAGLVSHLIQTGLHQRIHSNATGAFWAYHPHSAMAEVVDVFARPLHLKYIGGMRLYSQKKRLSMEALEAYYDWYHKAFKRKLRRPKSVPTIVVNGVPFEALPEPQVEAPTEAEGPEAL